MAVVKSLGKFTIKSGVVGQGGGMFTSSGVSLERPRGSSGGGTTVTPRTPEQQAAWFSSRGVTDTTPIGRTPSGALLFQTSSGQVISTTDLSLLTPSGKYDRALTREEAPEFSKYYEAQDKIKLDKENR